MSACTWSPRGVVTEAELDAIVTSSIGLRWAVGGPFRTFHLGGGPEGLPHFIQHLGPGLEVLWGQLGSPSFDAPTVELLVRQAQEAFGNRSVDALAAKRDRAQIVVLKALGESPTADGA